MELVDNIVENSLYVSKIIVNEQYTRRAPKIRFRCIKMYQKVDCLKREAVDSQVSLLFYSALRYDIEGAMV